MYNLNATPSKPHSVPFRPIVLPSAGQQPSAGPQPKDSALQALDSASQWLMDVQSPRGSTPLLSVIIPAYNEAKTLHQVIESVLALDIQKQLIIVDDGSSDGTREAIEALRGHDGITVVLHEKNHGKGAAIQSGIRLAIGDILIVQDADLEYDPKDILKVIKPILDGESDVVYGSRYLANSHQDQSALHRFGNACLTGFSNWMTNQRLTDMETCYKAFRRDLIQGIRIEQRRFGFEPEITAKLAKKQIVIREVPISYRSRSWQEGKKIGIKDLISTLYCIVRYRFQR
jgi:glycosyltransferase involved in cell wall biosynthesis